MINRRSFLITTTGLILGNLLSSCAKNYDLNVLLLQESIPPQLINGFKKQLETPINLNFKPESNLQKLYDLLLTWQGKNNQNQQQKSNFSLSSLLSFLAFWRSQEIISADLVTIGNYWLDSAIKEKLIMPLEIKNLTNWQNLPASFQNLVTRNNQVNSKNNSNSKIWAAPYRYGYTMIAYRQDKFESLGWQPQDWGDLWKPEIKQKISLLNQPREVIGLILKKLGYSYNQENLANIPQLKSELKSLHEQVKFYDSQKYLEPLILGDTWLTVGWSNDILPILATYKNIVGVIPLSGTSLSVDLWVKPKNQGRNENNIQQIYDWINFCWETESAQKINLFTNGISPIILPEENHQNIPTISQKVLNKSEFINPLSELSNQEYENLWKQINSSNSTNLGSFLKKGNQAKSTTVNDVVLR